MIKINGKVIEPFAVRTEECSLDDLRAIHSALVYDVDSSETVDEWNKDHCQHYGLTVTDELQFWDSLNKYKFNVISIREAKEMLGFVKPKTKTPAEEMGYKVGDKFIVNGDDTFTEGSVVSLYFDDGSYIPKFKLISGYCNQNCCDGQPGAFTSLRNVGKIKEDKESDFPDYDFFLSCGDKPEVRQWLKDNGCKWASGDDLFSVHMLGCKNLHIYVGVTQVTHGANDDKPEVFPTIQPAKVVGFTTDKIDPEKVSVEKTVSELEKELGLAEGTLKIVGGE